MRPFLLQHLVSNAADLAPDQVSFRCMGSSMTYGELDVKSNQCAHYLLAKGVQPGERIGVFLNRCLDTPIAVYGILKASAVFVPLDPFAPAERTKSIIKNCGIRFLVSNDGQRRALKKLVATNCSLQEIVGPSFDLEIDCRDWASIFTEDKSKPTCRRLSDDLAYVMYTSGTTGIPKGIMHTHGSGLAYAKLSADLYDVIEEDIIGNHSPLHFDISTFGYFTGPLARSTTIICSDAETKIPNSLAALIEEEQITIWYSVPLALIQILEGGTLDDRNFSNLRWILYGGEPFPVHLLQQLDAHTPGALWSNVYGPAEVNQCTYFHIDDPDQLPQSIPLGQIWSNTEFLIFDQEDQPVAEGEQGYLLIRSATMMQGYWRRPDLNKEAFYRRSTESGEDKFYRTGDLVRVDTSGVMHFEGRGDRQIKRRGYRIELDEVQAILSDHPDIGEAAVFVVDPDTESKQLYAGLKTGIEEDLTEKIAQYLHSRLPYYAVPDRLIFLKELPRTSAGKIDHKALTIRYTTESL